ncbi:Flp family type IVb pilin [Rhodoplanes sp. Z2-YC6860]|uniref:Flp family type IVb pilin n=1 Tax=Rhodoplanes sp. Z2-YC6860 TaxID=674703 RepID=UPI00082B8161
MLGTIRRFLWDQSGSTAIEYALIAAGISLGIISTLAATKDKLIATFTSAQDGLK